MLKIALAMILFLVFSSVGLGEDATTNKGLVVKTVELKEFKFVPDDLKFKVWKPTKLILKNTGGTKHYFVSEDFFNSIWIRKAEWDGIELKFSGLNAIELYPGKELELYFTPLKIGKYYLKCTIPGHEERGMKGFIFITK